jgi:hypothetical protein
MILPPALIYVDVCNERRNRFKLWLPVIIFWPLLLVAAMIIAPLAAIAEVLLFATGIKPLSIMIGVSRLVAALHGTAIEVSRKSGGNNRIKIFIQ